MILLRYIYITMSYFSCAGWGTVMFDKSQKQTMETIWWCTHNILFLACAVFQDISIEVDVKTVHVIVKNKSTTIFLSLYSYWPIERMSECSKLSIDLANKLSPKWLPAKAYIKLNSTGSTLFFGGGGGGGWGVEVGGFQICFCFS